MSNQSSQSQPTLFSLVVAVLAAASVVSSVTAQSCSSCAATIADAEVCTRLCQGEVPRKWPNPAWDGSLNIPQFLGTSPATEVPPNVFYGDVSASLLWQCLDTTRDEPIRSAEQLGNCCMMTDACKATLTEATACQRDLCLDPNIKTYTRDYFNCVSTGGCINDATGTDHGAFCLQLTFGSGASPTDSSQSGLEYIYDTIQTTNNCSTVDPFIDSVCSISDNCCPKCSQYMGKVLDIVMNGVVLNGNLTSDPNFVDLSCPIDHNRCCLNGICPTTAISRSGDGGRTLRTLQQQEEEVVEEEEPSLSEIDEITNKCTTRLSRDMIAYNETFAGSRFIGCLQNNLAKLVLEQEAAAGASPSAAPVGEGSIPSSAMTRMALTTGFAVVVSAFVAVV